MLSETGSGFDIPEEFRKYFWDVDYDDLSLKKYPKFIAERILNFGGMKKKVFVSGCFDMLHSGHVAFFEEAAGYGDLYVGIGSDRTISDLKGRRTINGERERLYMIRSLRCVKDAWINKGSGYY